MPVLSLLVWVPILSGIGCLFFRKEEQFTTLLKVVQLVLLLCLFLCVILCKGYQPKLTEMQWYEQVSWFPQFHVYYALGVDAISISLIILTCLMTFIVSCNGFHHIAKSKYLYLSAFLIMQGLICGTFCALDAILFYVFWEATLIPMFLIIGLWGGPRRVYASLKFFLYTFLGSILLLVSILVLYRMATNAPQIQTGDVFNILAYQKLPISLFLQKWLFLGMFIAFAIKVPMFPVHTWLPDAHVEAPTGGSVLLAAVLLKLGAYGFLRFLLPILPDASRFFSEIIVRFSIIAIIYISLIAFVQKDLKKLIAYSSISHMGFVTLAFFLPYVINPFSLYQPGPALGLQGAIMQMISHGLVSAGLFIAVGVLYEKLNTRQIENFGGVAQRMPFFTLCFTIIMLANMGFPGTSGFVGEFMIILTAFKVNIWVATAAASILVFGASYNLWMYRRVFLGPIIHDDVLSLTDIRRGKKLIFLSLIMMILALGLQPKMLLGFLQPSIQKLVTQMTTYKVAHHD